MRLIICGAGPEQGLPTTAYLVQNGRMQTATPRLKKLPINSPPQLATKSHDISAKMAASTPKPIHSLVLDAGPFIKNDPPVSTLLAQAEKLYITPAVLAEIKDPHSKARLELILPFITVRSPQPASVKVISDFARRTGDLEVLSRPDIHLMALTYELECERNHGDWRLRSVPGQKRLNGAPPGTVTEKGREKLAEELANEPAKSPTPSAPAPETRGAWGTSIPVSKPATDSVEKVLEATHISQPREERLEKSAEGQAPEEIETVFTSEAITAADPEPESEGSDDEGWITPANLKAQQAKDAGASSEPLEEAKTMQVALITSDFAMQNVLLRMNLNLLSPSLQRIRQVKTWILRCHACFSTTKDMSKQFCGRCGKPTLLRTSCSTDKDGNFQVNLKKNMQWNKRGDVYSIPKPVAGTSNGKLVMGGGKGGWGQDLILAEDQKEYVQAMTSARRRKERDLMDEDYLPNILSGDRRHGGNKPKVGAGRAVNSRKRN